MMLDLIASALEKLAIGGSPKEAVKHIASLFAINKVCLYKLREHDIPQLIFSFQNCLTPEEDFFIKTIDKAEITKDTNGLVEIGDEGTALSFTLDGDAFLVSLTNPYATVTIDKSLVSLLKVFFKQLVKHVQKSQQKTSELLETFNPLILDLAGEGIFQLNKEGEVVYVNKPGIKMLRLEEGVPIPQRLSFFELLDMPQKKAVSHPIQLTLRKGSPQELDYQVFRRTDNTTFPAEVLSSGIINNAGKVEGAVVAVKDISEKFQAKEAEKKLLKHVSVRVKELDCLYKISRLTVDISQDEQEVLQKIADLIPQIWGDEWVSFVRIKYKKQILLSKGFEETVWGIEQPILAQKKKVGVVQVYHPDAPDKLVEQSFFQKEAILLETICSQIGNFNIRKEAQDALKESNRKFTTLISNLPGVVFRTNHSWELEFLSTGCYPLSGYSPKDFLKKKGQPIKWSSLVHPEDLPAITKKIRSAVNNRLSYQVDYRIKTKNGKEKWVWEQGIGIYEQDKLKAVEGFLFDVTSNKKAEQELINSYKERQNLVIHQKAVLEKTVKERTEDLEALLEESRAQSQRLVEKEHQLYLQNKELFDALEKLKSAQTKLVQSEKMASLGQLTAGIAHEINNPVNFISSSIEGLKDLIDDLVTILKLYEDITEENFPSKLKEITGLKDKLEYNELLVGLELLTKNIYTGVERTTEIVNELKTFSRVDQAEVKTIDLHKNIDSTLVMLRSQYKDEIKIEKYFGDLPEIECFPGKLNQVFLNLIQNAIHAIQSKEGEYTEKKALLDKEGYFAGNIHLEYPPKKTIRIVTSELDVDEVQELELDERFSWVEVSIADSGVGIAPTKRDKLFDPFFTTKDVGEGTGLGLSVSLGIIEQHKGKIELISEEGRGAVFKILLPTSASLQAKD